MNGSIYTGSSALSAYQKAIDVESNNVANVNTVGFKSDTVSFSDLMYQGGVGKGVTMNEPVKNFNQGHIQLTGLDYDFAISGEGFFTVVDPHDESVYYTRAGNFRKDAQNNLVDINENHVMGVLPIVSGDKITEEFTKNIGSSIIDDELTIISLNTFATDYTKSAISTGQSGSYYKSASDNISDIEELKTAYQSAILAYESKIEIGAIPNVHIDSVTYPIVADDNGNYTLEVTVDGIKFQQDFEIDIAMTLNMLSNSINKTAGITSSVDTSTGIMTIESLIAGEKMVTSKAKANNQNLAINLVSQESGSGQNLIEALYSKLQTLIEANGGQLATIKTEIGKTPTGTPPNLGKISLDLDSLGISNNMIGELENDNGDIYLVQGNAKFLVAKIAAVLFQESSSLSPEGHNLYSATSESGNPLFVAEKAEILNNHVEVSSTNLSEGLVNLMVWQKAFDANSKSITTSDELLKTALALKTK
jgi:flagellar hook protein FlgE